MNLRRCHFLLAPLFAVMAVLLGLAESASGAFNPAATEPPYGENLLWDSEASASEWMQSADPARGNGEWIYDGASGVPVYVRQNPWTYFDPHGLNPSAVSASMNFEHNFGGIDPKAVGFGIASWFAGGAAAIGIVEASPIAAWGLTPGGAYTEAETVSTGVELATGYDGPPIIPGPGDAVRAAVQNADEVVEVAGELAGSKTARDIVEDTWTSIDSKGNIIKTDIEVRSIDDPSLLGTRGRGKGSHGELAESAGLTEASGLYGTTTVSVNGKINEVMIGSDAFEKLPKKMLQEQREIIAQQHEIPVEKVHMNKKSIAEDE